MKKFISLLLAIILFPIIKFFPTNKKTWIFGSQDGEAYIDNSKYFFEFVLRERTQIKPVWITRSQHIYSQLKNEGIPVCHNLSFKGIWYVVTASLVVFSTSRSDILFAHSKHGRKFLNLWHGMPMKKIVFDYKPHLPENKNWKGKIIDFFVIGFKHSDVTFISSTSPFFTKILKSAFKNPNVYSTGQPRTDIFFSWNKDEIKNKLGFEKDSFIITYMPTHRAYGKGKPNPEIFKFNNEAKEFFKQNNIKIIWKFHKNMVAQLKDKEEVNHEIFRDLSKTNSDPQEILFASDVLITDFSSCYIDYLLLNRPIGFYFYDNYEKEDNELYFSPSDHNIGKLLYEENEMLEWIKKCFNTKEIVDYSDKHLYHSYFDNNSSSRLFNLLTKTGN